MTLALRQTHPATPCLLRYRFRAGQEYRVTLQLQTESRARYGGGCGEAESSSQYDLVTRVIDTDCTHALLECREEGSSAPPARVRVDSQGHVAGGELLPGAWFPLPDGHATPGTSWRGSARPFQMSSPVTVEYHFDRVETRNGRRCAVVSWGSAPVTTPDDHGGRQEFRAWGTSVLDLDEGCLVEARSVTRSKHFGVGWETDSIAQLDLSLG